MSKELHTEIEIAASAERVWKELTNFPAYPTWNPLVPAVTGPLIEGGRLRVTLALAGRKLTIKPRIVRLMINRELTWRGTAPVPGLFAGVHHFEIVPLGSGVRFHQWEAFSGLLVPLLGRVIDGTTRRAYEAMNVALKARAERPA